MGPYQGRFKLSSSIYCIIASWSTSMSHFHQQSIYPSSLVLLLLNIITNTMTIKMYHQVWLVPHLKLYNQAHKWAVFLIHHPTEEQCVSFHWSHLFYPFAEKYNTEWNAYKCTVVEIYFGTDKTFNRNCAIKDIWICRCLYIWCWLID